MRIRMYNMNALNAFVSKMTSSLESVFTNFNVTTPAVKFTKDSTTVEYKISNVDGLQSITFDIDNEDFGLWVILTQDEGSKATFKCIDDFDEKLDKIRTNNMLKMQLDCIKSAVEESIE